MRSLQRYAVLGLMTGLLLAGCGSPSTTPPSQSPITVSSIQNNQEVSSNAPIIGQVTTEKPVKKLLYKVNGGTEVDVSTGINKNALKQDISQQATVTKFSFSISSEKFNEGNNTITIIVEVEDGTRYTITITVIYNPDKPPVAGRDVVVLNDINPWGKFDHIDNLLEDPNNVKFIKNLLNFTPPANERKNSKVVVFDRGHGSGNCKSVCSDSTFNPIKSVIEDAGYTLRISDTSTGALGAVAADVKLLFLWLPQQTFTNTEINHLKKFALEGGRIVFVGEHSGFYGGGIAIENDFLKKMGAVMTNKGQAVDCGTNVLPATSIKTHQITTGLTGLSIACSSVLELGPNDFPLFTSKDGTKVLSAVAAIDLTPLPTN